MSAFFPVDPNKGVPQNSSHHMCLQTSGTFSHELRGAEPGEDALKTCTDEFEQWLGLISDDFDLHFIKVKKGGKTPLVEKGRSWKEPEFRLDAGEAKRWLEEGGNVAFVPRGTLVVIDVDDEEGARKLLDSGLFDTLAVRTRSGGIHLYFENKGVENADASDVLEIRAEWRYVLVPGSYVDPGDTGGNGKYEVANAVSPLPLVSEDIPEQLRRGRVEGEDFVPTLRLPGEPLENKYGWKLEECREEDEKLDALLTYLEFDGMPEEAQELFDFSGDHSKSVLDMSAAYKLAYWEFDLDTCIDILREYRSRKKMERVDSYVEPTVEKALKRKKVTVSDHHDPETWEPGSGDIHDRITIGGNDEDE